MLSSGYDEKTILLAVVLLCASAVRAEKLIRYEGKVDSISGRKLHMTLRDGSTGDWTIDARVNVSRLKAGDGAIVMVSQEGVVHSFHITEEKPHAGRTQHAKAPAGALPWAEQKGKGRWWGGEVVEVDEAKKEFELRREGGNETIHFKVDPKTGIYSERAGRKAEKTGFGDVRKGKIVEAYAMDGRCTQVKVREGAR